jgi:hypothetical protein
VAACTSFHHQQASRKPGDDDTLYPKVIDRTNGLSLYDCNCKQPNTNDGVADALFEACDLADFAFVATRKSE